VLPGDWLEAIAIVRALPVRPILPVMPIMRNWGAMRRSAHVSPRGDFGCLAVFVLPIAQPSEIDAPSLHTECAEIPKSFMQNIQTGSSQSATSYAANS
jgi:hypothetical protein